MNLTELLESLVHLRNRLDERVAVGILGVEDESQALGIILETFHLEAQYAAIKHDVDMTFCDDDLKKLKDAAAMHQQIVNQLRDMKQGKRKR